MDSRMLCTSLIFSGDKATSIFIGDKNDTTTYNKYAATSPLFTGFQHYRTGSEEETYRQQYTTLYQLDQ